MHSSAQLSIFFSFLFAWNYLFPTAGVLAEGLRVRRYQIEQREGEVPFGIGSGLQVLEEQEDGLKVLLVADGGADQPVYGVVQIANEKALLSHSQYIRNAKGTPLGGTRLADKESKTEKYSPKTITAIDPEGIALAQDGTLWLCDELGPYLIQLERASGRILKVYAPGHGLPKLLRYRVWNKGFEGITVSPSGKVFASLQSVLNVKGKTSTTASFIRLIELDPKSGDTRMFAYPYGDEFEEPLDAHIGALHALSDTDLLVLEQGHDREDQIVHRIYRIDISQATDISGLRHMDKHLEYEPDRKAIFFNSFAASSEKGAANSLPKLLFKRFVLDLADVGWPHEKAEGLALLSNRRTLVVSNDSDMRTATENLKTVRKNEIWLIDLDEALPASFSPD